MTVDAAVDKEGLFIPLIDFSKFLNGTPSERHETAKAVLHGFQNAGFIYLKNHSVSDSALKQVYSMSAKFFDQEPETKEKISWTTPESNRGYSAPGREKTSTLTDQSEIEKLRQAMPDLKESLDIGRDDVPEYPNRWPEEMDDLVGFKTALLEFWGQCSKLHAEVMRAIGVGMGYKDEFFDDYIDNNDNTLRILRYPEVKAGVFQTHPGTLRCGEHSDYGSITLLFQDNRGGLQVQNPKGQFVDATPIEGTVLVNAGDLLARWSNDTIKSTIHRVVEPPRKESEVYPARYSIAYFCNPNSTANIDVLPGTYATDAEKKYTSINSGEYLVQRLTATY